MERNVEMHYNIGHELWNERRVFMYKMSLEKKEVKGEIDIVRVKFQIQNGEGAKPVVININGQNRVTIGSDKNANLCIESDGVSAFHALINCDFGAIWLYDLAGVDYSTKLCLTRPFPIQMSDTIMFKKKAYAVVEEKDPQWYCGALVIDRLRQSHRQSTVGVEHLRSRVVSLPRVDNYSVGYSEKCDVCCKDSEMSKSHFKIMCTSDLRFYVSSQVESRLKYTAFLVGRAPKKDEVISWRRGIQSLLLSDPNTFFL